MTPSYVSQVFHFTPLTQNTTYLMFQSPDVTCNEQKKKTPSESALKTTLASGVLIIVVLIVFHLIAHVVT